MSFIVVNLIAATGSIRPIAVGVLSGLGYSLFITWREIGSVFYFNTGRLGATLINPNSYAFALLVGLLLLSYYLYDKKIKAIHLIFICLCFLTFSHQIIFITGSRKGIIGIFIILVSLIIFKSMLRKNSITYTFSYYLVGIVLLVGLYSWLESSPHFQRILNIQNFFAGKHIVGERSIIIRSEMLGDAIRLFLEKPILGWGFDQFAYISGWGTYSHNNIAELLVNQGFIGILIYYSIFILLLHYIISAIRYYDMDLKRICLWAFNVLIIVLFWQLLAVSYYDKLHWLVLSTILGLVIYQKNYITSKVM